ncbi:MAG: Asr1405/Asl0597 family protein [Cyanobacteria bacterium P01_D01_bin.36]
MSFANYPESASSTSHDLPGSPFLESVTVTCDDRWQVYQRLQSLDIDCKCGGFQPLEVSIQTPVEMLQLWSVVRHVSEPRAYLVDVLNRCWHIPQPKSHRS